MNYKIASNLPAMHFKRPFAKQMVVKAETPIFGSKSEQ